MGKQLVSATPGGAKIEWKEFLGKLFVIEPLEIVHDVKTENGETDVVRSNVYVITSKRGDAEEFEDTYVFPKVIQGQLRKAVGTGVVVGRLTQGPKQKGKNPPWVLADAEDRDLEVAGKFWASKSISGGSTSGADEGFEDDDDSF